jgi:type VI secretion system protein ImpG
MSDAPPQAVPPGGLKLDRGSVLNSRPVNGVPCKFRTCYDLTFLPLAVTEAEWKTPDRLQPPVKSSEAVAAVRIGLRCPGDLRIEKLE